MFDQAKRPAIRGPEPITRQGDSMSMVRRANGISTSLVRRPSGLGQESSFVRPRPCSASGIRSEPCDCAADVRRSRARRRQPGRSEVELRGDTAGRSLRGGRGEMSLFRTGYLCFKCGHPSSTSTLPPSRSCMTRSNHVEKSVASTSRSPWFWTYSTKVMRGEGEEVTRLIRGPGHLRRIRPWLRRQPRASPLAHKDDNGSGNTRPPATDAPCSE